MKVPKRLQAAVANVLGQGKSRQTWLKKSLSTKDLKTANVRGKPVLSTFDGIFRDSEKLILGKAAVSVRRTLKPVEIERMGEALFGKLLADDEAWRFGGRAHWTQMLAKERARSGEPIPAADVPEFGWSPAFLNEQKDNLAVELQGMQDALARGDISAVVDDVSILLADFAIDLDRSSSAYRELGTRVLMAYVGALKAIESRNVGLPVATPKFTPGAVESPEVGGTLRISFDSWAKARQRPKNTLGEYLRALNMFIEVHGNLPISEIKRSHARQYKEALQDVPRRRQGALLKASLPDLAAWGRKHPDQPKVSPATINKQLGAVQAIAVWGHTSGIVPEDSPWTDPFTKMRVPVDQSGRTSFDSAELQRIFGTPAFTGHVFPRGGGGVAAFWLPLLALFAGARQAEIAGLTVGSVRMDPETAAPLLYIEAQASRGRALKSKAAERAIPVHPELVRLGLLSYVETVRSQDGKDAWLFPLVAPHAGRAQIAAWSKWFGRYLRAAGVDDTNKVFHSFRHGFKDALTQKAVDGELRSAFMGHSWGASAHGGYGGKTMLVRFGIETMTDAIAKVEFRGLDLSGVRPLAK